MVASRPELSVHSRAGVGRVPASPVNEKAPAGKAGAHFDGVGWVTTAAAPVLVRGYMYTVGSCQVQALVRKLEWAQPVVTLNHRK